MGTVTLEQIHNEVLELKKEVKDLAILVKEKYGIN